MFKEHFIKLAEEKIDCINKGMVDYDQNDFLLRSVYQIAAPLEVIVEVEKFHSIQIEIADNAGIPCLQKAIKLLSQEIEKQEKKLSMWTI